jgi:beta-lactamase superfamily II metal-dependent hydrolase
MFSFVFRWIVLFCLGSSLTPLLHAAKGLQIYFIDVEGGAATLLVAPSGQSLLMDAGFRGFDDRDPERIAAALKAAGVKRLDYLLTTHYHRDHVGGVPHLADRVKIDKFLDHGPNQEDTRNAKEDYADYVKTLKLGEHVVVKTGDTIPIKDVAVQVVSAAGEVMKKPLPGGGQPNPACATKLSAPEDNTENAQAVGVLITYGRFRFLNLGDLAWQKEQELMCPNNPIGTVDLYLVARHGLNEPPAVLNALRPRVVVMNSGPRNLETPEDWARLKATPGLQDLWQLHFALEAGKDNTPDPFIANVDEYCKGAYLHVAVDPDASFTIYNQRNKFQKVYK